MHHEVGALLSDSLMKNDSIKIPIDTRLKFVGLQEMAEQTCLYYQKVLSNLLAFVLRLLRIILLGDVKQGLFFGIRHKWYQYISQDGSSVCLINMDVLNCTKQ